MPILIFKIWIFNKLYLTGIFYDQNWFYLSLIFQTLHFDILRLADLLQHFVSCIKCKPNGHIRFFQE